MVKGICRPPRFAGAPHRRNAAAEGQHAEGAFYVMLNISGVLGKRYQGAEITGSDSFAEMLINAKQVAVVPGKAFGADGPCAHELRHLAREHCRRHAPHRRIRIRTGIGHPGFFRFPIHGPPHFLCGGPSQLWAEFTHVSFSPFFCTPNICRSIGANLQRDDPLVPQPNVVLISGKSDKQVDIFQSWKS